MKALSTLLSIGGIIGFLVMVGSVGAMELDNISILQCILQSLLGFAITGFCIFIHRKVMGEND